MSSKRCCSAQHPSNMILPSISYVKCMNTDCFFLALSVLMDDAFMSHPPKKNTAKKEPGHRLPNKQIIFLRCRIRSGKRLSENSFHFIIYNFIYHPVKIASRHFAETQSLAPNKEPWRRITSLLPGGNLEQNQAHGEADGQLGGGGGGQVGWGGGRGGAE